MTQATREWSTLVTVFDERMTAYVRISHCLFPLPLMAWCTDFSRQEQASLFTIIDDDDLTHTNNLTLAVSAIRRFRDAISSTIDAWDVFEKGQIEYLQTTGSDSLRLRWEVYVAAARGNASELKSLRELLANKLELFNSMRDGVSHKFLILVPKGL